MKKGNYHSLTAAFFILSFTLIIALSTTGQAGAQSDLFWEDFQGYTFPPATPTLNGGIPKKSEGADKVWYGGRFDTPDTGTIDSDLAVGRSSSSSTANVFGRFEDEAGLLFNISTLGYTNVLLSFDYATYSAIDSDRLVAGYFIGELGFGTPTCTGEGEAGCFSNFTGSPTENWGNW
ncbi:MAG: hypothetical protein JSU90_00625, partial [Nitrospiraceae bacterium]